MSLPQVFQIHIESLTRLHNEMSRAMQELPVELQSYIPTIEECFGSLDGALTSGASTDDEPTADELGRDRADELWAIRGLYEEAQV